MSPYSAFISWNCGERSAKLGEIRRKASELIKKIEDLEEANANDDHDIDDNVLQSLRKLHRLLEAVKEEYENLRDPFLM